MECKRITVKGIVQGVGFRPFIYRIATKNKLKGSVKNLGDAGVEIIVEGEEEAIASFLHDLKEKRPPLASIDRIDVETIRRNGKLTEFKILKSDSDRTGSGTIPPDVATCDECLEDVSSNKSRYHAYWATSCVNCGPRFTVIYELPYDRERTSMLDFPMCEACRKEYTDPLDRRYHAQTIACPDCGPRLFFEAEGTINFADPIELACEFLKAGKIMAIKGIGGTHLACDASREDTVAKLRERRHRFSQPFAVMVTEEMLRKIAKFSEEERKMLRSWERPIVVLAKLKDSPLAPSIAPALHNVGIMLPYSALHRLIFAKIDFPLVMTSANLPGEPMLIENDEIRSRLSRIADGFLLHDRLIVARCDDSVMRLSGGGWKFLRRSRGWAPAPITVQKSQVKSHKVPKAHFNDFRLETCDCPLLALGAELCNTVALYADGKIYLSQHIGDVDDVETFAYLEETIKHMLKITGLRLPEHVACDLHPQFLTTSLAKKLGKKVTQVQHHHAHIASVMGEHGLEETVGIALDGIGYGTDGKIWGGEVLIAKRPSFKRVGGLSNVFMPGGDLATKYPARMVAGILYAGDKSGAELHWTLQEHVELGFRRKGELEAVIQQLGSGINVFRTSSAGRFLDAVSALLGICNERTYEGEPAMRLEAVAAKGRAIEIPLEFSLEEGRKVLNVPALFAKLMELKSDYPIEDIAATAQRALALGLALIAIEAAQSHGINNISLSGGVAYNDMITRTIKERVEEAGLYFYTNEKVPCGDGGISFGQIIVAGAK